MARRTDSRGLDSLLDGLARRLADRQSRRAALRHAGVAALVAAAWPAAAASADKDSRHGPKKGGREDDEREDDEQEDDEQDDVRVSCPQPATSSTYAASCQDIRLMCTEEWGEVLWANCRNTAGNLVATAIVVNTCSGSGYAISNCNGTLTCGTCP